MITKEDEGDPPRRSWSPSELFRLDARTVFWLAVQAVFFTAWLVNMHSDVGQLKRDRDEFHSRIDELIKQQIEHKFRIDQIREFLRVYKPPPSDRN